MRAGSPIQVASAWAVACAFAGVASAGSIAFNRDVRPILSDRCFACHGPDKNHREADLRLDTREGLFGERDEKPIVPGRPDDSPLIARIKSADPEERMPPPDNGDPLNEREIQILRQWIAEGAEWEGHWAFEPIQRSPIPDVGADAFVRSPIDAFVLAKLRERGFAPAPEADRRTLLRRLSFDLVGLPPSPEEVDAFVSDPRPDAYERQVDRLLASPHFGERMAEWWLDLVRYADTVGYHGDQMMKVSPFRDYVIASFNANKRFDVFTIQQLAGDLLPFPTQEDRVAAGYNRLGMMSAEGGVQDKEYLAKYIAERARNVGGAWLGVTVGCAECHDHKYDPFTTVDFYRLEAFFADIREVGLYGGSDQTGKWGPWMRVPTPEQARAMDDLDRRLAVARLAIDAPPADVNEDQAKWEKTTRARLAFEKLLPKAKWGPEVPEPIAKILASAPDQRAPAQRQELTAHFRSITPKLASARATLHELEAAAAALDGTIATTLATETVPPRTIRVLRRGNWMDDGGAVVEPGTPAFLPQLSSGQGRQTRRDLARWIVAPENPLTARVAVNRFWKLFFGAGLSRKLDDLGAQGEWPSHPELLDWLAGEFVGNGWDVQRTIKEIVLSNAYRQSSNVAGALRERDPDNRWLARQGCFRLDAEFVRDGALKISGLLNEKVGGPSVFPYQPAGYWAYLNFPVRDWPTSKGDDLYRRGLYAHWQRQYLHPSLLAFDAPSREECVADRARSNTPLQALALLNDPTYVEAARAFAEGMLRCSPDPSARLDWACRRALGRSPTATESQTLLALLEKHRAEWASDSAGVRELLAVGARAAPGDLDPTELAAWTSVARVLLNLHETITRY